MLFFNRAILFLRTVSRIFSYVVMSISDEIIDYSGSFYAFKLLDSY